MGIGMGIYRKSLSGKPIVCVLISILLLGLCACGAKEADQEGISGIVEEFHHGDYEYRKISLSGKEEEVTLVYEGKVIADPYEEYVRVADEFAASSMVQEMHYQKEDAGYSVQVKNADGSVVTQKDIQPPYPYYGHEKDLSFTFEGKEKASGVVCEVYQTKYQDTVGGEADRQNTESIEITIRQKYYIDMEKRRVVKVDTDLEELSRANSIINLMQSPVQKLSREEAEENVKKHGFFLQGGIGGFVLSLMSLLQKLIERKTLKSG